MEKKEIKNGACPIMSRPMLFPGTPAENLINMPGTPGVHTISIQVTQVPCMGEGCQLWDGINSRCSFVSSPFLQYGLEQLINNLPSPPGIQPDYSLTPLTALIEKISDYIDFIKEISPKRQSERKWKTDDRIDRD